MVGRRALHYGAGLLDGDLHAARACACDPAGPHRTVRAGAARNEGFEYVETVRGSAAGRSVLAYLADRYRHSHAAEWERRIRDGEVSLDGVQAAPGDPLRGGQILRWTRPPWVESAVPLDFAVLHADGDVLAVAKPSGLPTVPAGGFLAHTLLAIVRRRFPGATPVHRLGRGTSGVVLFALTPRARRALPAAWRARDVERVYVGAVEGRPAASRFTVESPIGLVPHPVLGTVHAVRADGRAARTRVWTSWSSRDATIVEARIETGRPHQIRIHLAAAGHPLVGDPLYAAGGLPRPGMHALPGDGGYLLHAARLTFPHPRSGVPTTVECGAPPGLRPPAAERRERVDSPPSPPRPAGDASL